jgi:hypothetical protein
LQGLNEESDAFQNAISERLGNFTRNLTTCIAGLIVGKECYVNPLSELASLTMIFLCSVLERMGHGVRNRRHYAIFGVCGDGNLHYEWPTAGKE